MDENGIQALFEKAIDISKQCPRDPEEQKAEHERSMRKALYFQHIENILDSLSREISQVVFETQVLEAARLGKRKALIYEVYGYYGPEKIQLWKEGVSYEGGALPVQFLAKGPKKSPQNRLYGLKFFTMNGIEPLVSRLQLRMSPFQVSVDISRNALQVFLSWNAPEEATNQDEDVVSLGGSDLDIDV